MSFPPSAGPRRRRHARLRTAAGLGLIAGSLLVGPGLALASAAIGPVAAAAPEDACLDVTDTVSMIGSSSAKEALINWAPEICESGNVVADYTDFGSKGGREAVTPGDAAVIGLTSLPFTEEEQTALQAEKRGIVMVPFLGSSVTCTYWDTNPNDPTRSGKRFPNLRISRGTLADFSGGSPRDGTNASEELAADNADNPDFAVGPPYLGVEVWFRSGSSAVTHELSNWFHQDEQAETDFVKGSLEGYVLPFEDIGTPDGSSPSLINDYPTMKARMLGSLQALGIGCMDGATSRTDAKPETEPIDALNLAWLDNPAGEFLAPTHDAVTAAIAGMVAQPDGTFTPDWELEDPEAYALPLLVYAAMPTCGIDAATRTGMDKVMSYAVGAGQADLPPGNVALPPNVAATATRQLANWRSLTEAVGPCKPVATTTTTSTTTTPASTTTSAYVPPAEESFIPPADSGVFTDPGFSPTTPSGEIPPVDAGSNEDAGAPVPVGTGAGAAPVSGPLAPLRRIVAVASGSQAMPPMAMAMGGAGLLLVGPGLQLFGGSRRTGTFASSAGSWFSRLRP